MIQRFGLGNAAFVASSSTDTVVLNWAARCITNGGSPTERTVMVLNRFYHQLTTDNLLSKMKGVNCFVPDDLICSITPLIVGTGVDPWTNVGFVASDLSIAGLKGNGSSKYLKTGLNPLTVFASTNQGGMTLYNTTSSNSATEQDMGCLTTSPGAEQSAFQFHISVGGNAVSDCFSDNTGRINTANSLYMGYMSMNRLNATDYRIFQAKSTLAHVQFAVNTTSCTFAPPNRLISVFCGNYGVNYATPFSYSTKRLSFAALHDGLTSAESSLFFTAIQNLRIDLGGGYL